MVLQHVVRYCEAHGWIWLQDQSQLTYKALLAYCQLLKSQCKEKDQADLTSLLALTSSASSIHQDALTTLPKCPKYGYSHPHKCPAYGKECFNCDSLNQHTTLCRRTWRVHHLTHNTRINSPWPRGRLPQSESRNCSQHHHSSSRHRSCCLPSTSRCSCHNPSQSLPQPFIQPFPQIP